MTVMMMGQLVRLSSSESYGVYERTQSNPPLKRTEDGGN